LPADEVKEGIDIAERVDDGRFRRIQATTVKTHVARILQKLDLRDRVQAVVLANEAGLVQAGERSANESHA